MPEPDLGMCSLLRYQNTAQRGFYFVCKTHSWTSPMCYDEEDRVRFLSKHCVDVRPPPPSKPMRVWRSTLEKMEARDRERLLADERGRMMDVL